LDVASEVFVSEAVSQALRLYQGLVDEEAWERTACDQIELLARRLLEGRRARSGAVVFELASWLPGAGSTSRKDLLDRPLSLEDALGVISRAHGFASWNEAKQAGESRRGDPVFEAAVERVLAGDLAGLSEALDDALDLVARCSHYGHRATLLHYLAANGVETYRQRVLKNAAAIAALLLERGADPNAKANMYGGGQTMRALLVTSSHPAEAGVTPEVAAVLDGAGAE
jgi:hypothetical protein